MTVLSTTEWKFVFIFGNVGAKSILLFQGVFFFLLLHTLKINKGLKLSS